MNESPASASTTVQQAIQIVLYSVLLLLGCTFNGATIWLVHRHRSLQTVIHLWVISLCWSHLLTAVITIPFAMISTASDDWLLGKEFCQISGYCNLVFRTVSIVSIAGIAVDRYHVISRPFSKRMQKKTAKTLVVFTWWSSLVACSPPLVGVGLYRYSPNHHLCQVSWVFGGPGLIYTVFYITAIYLSTVLTTLCSYRLIYKVTQKQAMKHKRAIEARVSMHGKASLSTSNENMASNRNQTRFTNNRFHKILTSYCAVLASRFQNNSVSNSRSNIDRKSNQIIVMVLLVFLIAWSPYFGFALYSAIDREEKTNFSIGRRWLEFIVTWLSLSTCVWDPLLYAAFTKNFKNHFRSLLGCFCNPLKHCWNPFIIGKSCNSQSAPKVDRTAQDKDEIDRSVYHRQRSRITNTTEVSCDIQENYYFEQNPSIVPSLSKNVLHTSFQPYTTSSLRQHHHSKRNRKLIMTSKENASFVDDTDASSHAAVVEMRQSRTRFEQCNSARYPSAKLGQLTKTTQLSHVPCGTKSSGHPDKEMTSSLTSKLMSIADERKLVKATDVKSKEATKKFLMIKTSSHNVTPTKEIALQSLKVNKKVHEGIAHSPLSHLKLTHIKTTSVSPYCKMKS